MAKIDPQHLLLVGAALFAVVTFFALRGLGGSGATAVQATGPTVPVAVSAPERLASANPARPSSRPAPSTTAPTTAAPQAMAMGLPAALLDSPQSQVFRLYRTALGREPDRNGFAFWSDQVRAGVPLERLAQEFLASEEYVGQFGDETGWDSRVEQLMTNAFGPPDDQAQLDAWRERFRGLDGAALLLAISEADETLAATGTLP